MKTNGFYASEDISSLLPHSISKELNNVIAHEPSGQKIYRFSMHNLGFPFGICQRVSSAVPIAIYSATEQILSYFPRDRYHIQFVLENDWRRHGKSLDHAEREPPDNLAKYEIPPEPWHQDKFDKQEFNYLFFMVLKKYNTSHSRLFIGKTSNLNTRYYPPWASEEDVTRFANLPDQAGAGFIIDQTVKPDIVHRRHYLKTFLTNEELKPETFEDDYFKEFSDPRSMRTNASDKDYMRAHRYKMMVRILKATDNDDCIQSLEASLACTVAGICLACGLKNSDKFEDSSGAKCLKMMIAGTTLGTYFYWLSQRSPR